jgi:hypothetical protein
MASGSVQLQNEGEEHTLVCCGAPAKNVQDVAVAGPKVQLQDEGEEHTVVCCVWPRLKTYRMLRGPQVGQHCADPCCLWFNSTSI